MKNISAVFIIFIASFLLSLPLLKPGLHVIHDDQQIARLFLFDQSLKGGQIPPRWVDELGFGFGYPLFVFYPPLVYIIGEAYHLIGFNFIDSIKLVFFTGIFASGIAIYILVKEFWGRYAGLGSAIFYMLVPYRALDIYVRGALAESFAFVFLPLILWAFYKLLMVKNPLFLSLAAISLALLMIAHNLIFMPFMMVLAPYLLFLIIQSKEKLLAVCRLLFAIVLAGGLSAFFWLPALLEKKFTIVDKLLLVNLADYNIHFVYLTQLWNWPWGFGGSAAGLADGISFKIGKLHILASIAALIIAAIQLFKIRSKTIIHNSYSIIFLFGLFLFSAFMTTFYAKFIWDLLPSLGYIQFPWRFLVFTALFSSILAGALIYNLRLAIVKVFVILVFSAILTVTNLKLFRPQEYRLSLDDREATSDEVINWYVSRSSFEYVPRGIELYTGSLGTNLVKIEKSEIPSQKIEVLSGLAMIENLYTSPQRLIFNISSQDEAKIKVNVFNFSGWQAKIDGALAPIDDNNKFKLITLIVPKGDHQVKIEFKNTPVMTAANLITLGAILQIALLFFRKRIFLGKFFYNNS